MTTPRKSGRRPAPPPAPPPEAPPPAPAPANVPVARKAELLERFFYRPDEDAPDLGLDEASPLPEAAADEERTEYLSFWLSDEEHAVPIRLVREIQKPPPITEVPRAAAHVLGVITLRGEVIPVFDPRVRLGLARQEPTRDTRVMIVDLGEGPSALVVDRVGGVVRLAPSEIEPTPHGLGAAEGELLAGVGRSGGTRLLILLDLPALLRAAAGRTERP